MDPLVKPQDTSQLVEMGVQLLDLAIFEDADRGALGVLDNLDILPFETKRVFYHFGSTNLSVRGEHAHRECRQLIIPVCGFCSILIKNKIGEVKLDLNGGINAYLIPPLTWISMTNFSGDFVAFTLADQHYDPSDYIYDLDSLMELN